MNAHKLLIRSLSALTILSTTTLGFAQDEPPVTYPWDFSDAPLEAKEFEVQALCAEERGDWEVAIDRYNGYLDRYPLGIDVGRRLSLLMFFRGRSVAAINQVWTDFLDHAGVPWDAGSRPGGWPLDIRSWASYSKSLTARPLAAADWEPLYGHQSVNLVAEGLSVDEKYVLDDQLGFRAAEPLGPLYGDLLILGETYENAEIAEFVNRRVPNRFFVLVKLAHQYKLCREWRKALDTEERAYRLPFPNCYKKSLEESIDHLRNNLGMRKRFGE